MTNKEKLITLLKSDKEIKKDLEELRFGCLISDIAFQDDEDVKKGKLLENWEEDGLFNYSILSDDTGITTIYADKEEIDLLIIKNPIEERHFRMYCANKNRQPLMIGMILDNKKSFNNQSEEVYGDILNFLEK